MDVVLASSFAKDFRALNDRSLEAKVKSILESIKMAKNIASLTQFKEIYGSPNLFKMGIGFYLLVGVMTSENEITLIRCLHRDEVIKAIDKKIE